MLEAKESLVASPQALWLALAVHSDANCIDCETRCGVSPNDPPLKDSRGAAAAATSTSCEEAMLSGSCGMVLKWLMAFTVSPGVTCAETVEKRLSMAWAVVGVSGWKNVSPR